MIYILNIAGGVLAIAAITTLMVLLIKAERKLAKHGESWMYKNPKNSRKSTFKVSRNH